MREDRGIHDHRRRVREDRNERLNQEERTFNVDRELAIELLFGEGFDRLPLRDAGIDESDVERAELCLDPVSKRALFRNAGRIRLDDQCRRAERGLGLGDRLGVVAVDRRAKRTPLAG